MVYFTKEISLYKMPRGFHEITPDIKEDFPELKKIQTGLLNVFSPYTDASLSVTEIDDVNFR